MDNPFSEENLLQAASGNIDTLAAYDANGFLLGADESAEDFAKRIRLFQANRQKLEDALQKDGKYDAEGIIVTPGDRIPNTLFAKIAEHTKRLYRFQIDWVPGFFIDPSFSLLFGGCAFCSYPDFFTMFIIRRTFKTQEKWLIYNRDELLAHELCHVARIALLSEEFEETFAYQTSSSSFRKLIGGIFRKQTDSFMFLGVTFILLFAQILRTQWIHTMPIWPFWSLVGLVFAWLLIRHAFHCRRLGIAQRHIAELFGADNAFPVMFRCTDEELHRFASTKPQTLKTWILEQSSLRWQIIRKRFPLRGAES
ncbi:MAG: hypothetical protein J5743_11225 [Victivallales bacterium]|nr:hypothetical protein [Victivallales bacterium]